MSVPGQIGQLRIAHPKENKVLLVEGGSEQQSSVRHMYVSVSHSTMQSPHAEVVSDGFVSSIVFSIAGSFLALILVCVRPIFRLHDLDVSVGINACFTWRTASNECAFALNIYTVTETHVLKTNMQVSLTQLWDKLKNLTKVSPCSRK